MLFWLVMAFALALLGLPFCFKVGSTARWNAIQVSTAGLYLLIAGGVVVLLLLLRGGAELWIDARVAAQCECCAPVTEGE